MSVGREIRTKITSVKNTQKITKAMELVATSKMRKTQLRMAVSKPYATKMRAVIGHIANASSEYRHHYFDQKPEQKNIGVIVVSSDRGLCGGLNINLFKTVIQNMRDWNKQGINIQLCTVGRKAESFFRRIGADISAKADNLGDKPSVADLIGVVKVMLDRFEKGEIDTLYIASNTFVNTMTQDPTMQQLLPLQMAEDDSKSRKWDYIYEPEARSLLEDLLSRYIETQVYQSVVENIACEQAARMVAMKSATDNASDLIDELQQMYNKARQAAITQEISEIVSGAAAV